ncbi:hypothetical protein LXL04_023487 [Taraxacum kok-saghyz]
MYVIKKCHLSHEFEGQMTYLNKSGVYYPALYLIDRDFKAKLSFTLHSRSASLFAIYSKAFSISGIGRRQNPSRREAAVHVFRPSLPETLAQSHSSSSCYRAGDLGFLDTLYQIGELREASSPLLWLELQVSLVIVFCSSNSQNTASAQNNEQHSKEPHTPIKNQTPENPDVVLYYGPDLGVSPLNFRDVLLQSQALEGITMSMIVGAPNEEEILLLHDLYRKGGSPWLVKRILDLSKAFSVYSEEVLANKKELLHFAQDAIAGLKINVEILRLLLQKIYIAKRKLERPISSLPKKHID